MQAAEQALIDAGSNQASGVDALMQLAGRGAAEWIYRIAWPKPVTVLCGPGNNGGDGYVIAEGLRERGLPVTVVEAFEPATEAAHNARAAYAGGTAMSGELPFGAVLVDCLFGSGLTRPLDPETAELLRRLAGSHRYRIAIDLPSGIESDSGRALNDGLPSYDLTLALGAWKFAHWTMPAAASMGARHLVPIGIGEVPGAAQLLGRPKLAAPALDAHKYTRGLLAVVAGAMPGAALLASEAAMRGGAGYVKLAAHAPPAGTPADLVVQPDALADTRLSAVLIGPGLGRGDWAREKLAEAMRMPVPRVIDADALLLMRTDMLASRSAALVATPHEGELAQLADAFDVHASGKGGIARKLAQRVGMIVIAKGSDTLIAAPDGRVAIARPAPSWLSTAGTGDVLAGIVASRLATGTDGFDAACEAVWLHGEAARRAGPALTPSSLIAQIPAALAACL
ncbi:MAG: NAD(P)H-hydrate dehydratase [Candidatus Andeanibacterium colombiense]|uniref:ADP-dependent (S)-NAD(P)H-hydrate dehydratase n=1 Tax=Candidatus Andeanibacterium colombiense TaxID=3121345 RepID=A0AAJ5X9Q8_9SPHN|nr:MAG: NAD(P)H-hydrate dehydratase [Sphingomonadaceae bacterium]